MAYYTPVELAFTLAAFLVVSAIGTMVSILRVKNARPGADRATEKRRGLPIVLGAELLIGVCLAIPVFTSQGWAAGALFSALMAIEVFICLPTGFGIGVSLLVLGRVDLNEPPE